jgi:hypothetical protein
MIELIKDSIFYTKFVVNVSKHLLNDITNYITDISDITKYITDITNLPYIYIYEGSFLSPLNPIVFLLTLQLIRSYKNKKIKLRKDIDVTFSRLNTGFMNKLDCDWCSIVNGSSHVLSKYKTPDNNFWLKIAIIYMKLSQLFRKKQIDVHNYDMNELKKILEQTELRWCPFKSMKKTYYRNKNSKFINETEETIRLAGKYLSKFDTIECMNCSKELNKYFDENMKQKTKTKKEMPDLMNDYLNYINNILKE